MLLALLLSIPAIIHEMKRRHQDHPLLIDIEFFCRQKCSDRQSFALGILFHLVMGLGFGVLYPLNPEVWSFAGPAYGIQSLAAYGIALFLFANVIVFPFMGLGFFGKHEDRWIWLETLISMIVLVVAFYFVVQWFQPSWF